MKVVILPGGTSPYSNSKKHVQSYQDICGAVRRLEPSAEVLLFTYPGQRNSSGFREGELTFQSSYAALMGELESSESSDVRLLCFCWGCQIGAAACAQLTFVRKALFWAPLPLWMLQETCVLTDDLWRGKEDQRGVKVTPAILERIRPFEMSIQRIKNTRCCLAAGDQDEYVNQGTSDYFSSLSKDGFRQPLRIPGCGHTVNRADPGWVTFEKEALSWALAPPSLT